jgi:hypothetical protein
MREGDYPEGPCPHGPEAARKLCSEFRPVGRRALRIGVGRLDVILWNAMHPEGPCPHGPEAARKLCSEFRPVGRRALVRL